MSGLMLCRDVEVNRPYYVKDLGLNLYSIEELCYYIYNHVFLIEEDFFGEELLGFIGTDLRMPALEKKLRLWIREEADLVSLLMVVLQDGHYYSEKELAIFKDQMTRIRSAKPYERTRQKADYMLQQRKYETALRLYESLLPTKENPVEDLHFLAKVCCNRGTAYVQLFNFREAAACYEESFVLSEDEAVLKNLYFVYRLDPTLPVQAELMAQVPAETQLKWQEEFEQARKRAEFEGKSVEVREVLEKNSFRRPAALEAMIGDWKKEYRSLVR